MTITPKVDTVAIFIYDIGTTLFYEDFLLCIVYKYQLFVYNINAYKCNIKNNTCRTIAHPIGYPNQHILNTTESRLGN